MGLCSCACPWYKGLSTKLPADVRLSYDLGHLFTDFILNDQDLFLDGTRVLCYLCLYLLCRCRFVCLVLLAVFLVGFCLRFSCILDYKIRANKRFFIHNCQFHSFLLIEFLSFLFQYSCFFKQFPHSGIQSLFHGGLHKYLTHMQNT